MDTFTQFDNSFGDGLYGTETLTQQFWMTTPNVHEGVNVYGGVDPTMQDAYGMDDYLTIQGNAHSLLSLNDLQNVWMNLACV